MAYGKVAARGYGRKVGKKRVGGIRRARGYLSKMRVFRKVRAINPTFVETFHDTDYDIKVPAGSGMGQVFYTQINKIPQWQQYATLYKQYRINWVKVTLIPQTSGTAQDWNAAGYNSTIPLAYQGMGRIAWAIQDSPDVSTPLTEETVLKDNGSKIRPFKNMWSCSFKPVPDVTEALPNTNPVYTRQRYRQWFNFGLTDPGNTNPLHGAVQVYITLPGNGTTTPSAPSAAQTYFAYFKVSFSLRDPI